MPEEAFADYEHTALPGENYIRVLTLQPGKFGDPIVCSMDAMSLDDPVEYAALSYSWAMEDGENSPCREMILLDDAQSSLIDPSPPESELVKDTAFVRRKRKRISGDYGERTGFASAPQRFKTRDGSEDFWCAQGQDSTKRKKLITRNLYEGLQRIRHESLALNMWIDAVCINQAIIPERNSQVARMAEIYKKAAKVIVWLGEGHDPQLDRRAFAVLECSRKLGHRPEYGDDGNQLQQWATRAFAAFVEGLEVTLKPDAKIGADFDLDIAKFIRANPAIAPSILETAKALQALYTRRYWFRRWILQEYVLPRTMDWYWGDISLPNLQRSDDISIYLEFATRYVWEGIEHVFGKNRHQRLGQRRTRNTTPLEDPQTRADLKTAGAIFDDLLHRTTQLVSIDEQRRLFDWRQQGDLNHLPFFMAGSGAASCFDDRDRLYAIISLDRSCGISPDYSLDTRMVYITYARTLVEKNWTWYLLRHLAQKFEGRTRDTIDDDDLSSSLPSWVPDLRVPSPSKFDAGSSNRDIDFHVESDSTLSCKLYLIGICDEVSTPVHDESRPRRARVQIRRPPENSFQQPDLVVPGPEWLVQTLRIDDMELAPLCLAVKGDLICCTTCRENEHTDIDKWFVAIRRAEGRVYRFVQAFSSFAPLIRAGDEKWKRLDLRAEHEIMVKVV